LHTLTADACAQEAVESKKTVEEKIQKPVIGFAYPFGDYNNAQKAALKKKLMEGGFQCAFLVEAGYVCKESDPFELKRLGIGGSPLGMTVRDLAAVVQQNRY
jgi:hypothetical protein